VREAEHSKQWSAERQHIWNPRKICGSSVYAISSEPQQITPTLLYSISYCLIAFPLTPKHVTLNYLFESPFCLEFCFVPVCLELWNLAFEAWLLNLQWMLSAIFKPKRTAAASRGFLATARLSVIKSAWPQIWLILHNKPAYYVIQIYFSSFFYCEPFTGLSSSSLEW